MKASWQVLVLVGMAVAACLAPSWPLAATLEEMGVPSSVAKSVTFVQVRDTQAFSGDILLRAAVGIVINAEGYILTSSEPFGGRSKINRSVRLQVVAGPFGALKPAAMELALLDASLGVALLKPKDEAANQPFLRFTSDPTPLQSSVTVAISPLSDTSFVAVMRDVRNVSKDDLGLRGEIDMPDSGALVGAPVLERDTWRLLGVVSGIDMNGAVELVPASALGPALKLAKIGPVRPEESTPAKYDSYPIHEEQTVHLAGPTKIPYQRTYSAPTGYRISDTAILVGSSNGLSGQPFVKIDEDKRTATLQFVLESGPAWDRKRGWLEGELRVNLVPEGAPASK